MHDHSRQLSVHLLHRHTGALYDPVSDPRTHHLGAHHLGAHHLGTDQLGAHHLRANTITIAGTHQRAG